MLCGWLGECVQDPLYVLRVLQDCHKCAISTLIIDNYLDAHPLPAIVMIPTVFSGFASVLV